MWSQYETLYSFIVSYLLQHFNLHHHIGVLFIKELHQDEASLQQLIIFT
jgi:hypothetical protein